MNTNESISRDEEIANRAYAIWESEGRVEGRAWDHWLQAEREMNGTHESLAPASRPASDSTDL